jgi:iron complex transport system permease protein
MRQGVLNLLFIVLAILVFLAVVIWSMQSGSAEVGLETLFSLWGHTNEAGSEEHVELIMALRGFRVLTVVFSGAVLSLCGLYMQALVRNPMADPYLLGASSGAGFGVSLISAGFLTVVFSVWFLPVVAFVGSLLSLILVLLIGRWRKEHQTYRILIAGIAVSSFFTALTGLMMYVFTGPDAIRSVLFWTLGSFSQSSQISALVSGLALIPALAFGIIRARRLDVMSLGEIPARTLGLDIQKFRIEILLVCAFSAGLVAAFSGPVGFVGLMMPHFSRALFGMGHRLNVWILPWLGGTYLLICDTLGREIFPPAGIPIGIITALFGIPFFIFLLGRKLE